MYTFETVADILLLSIVPLVALVTLSNSAWRLSLRIAGFLHFQRPDGILLILTLFAGLVFLILFFASGGAYNMTGGFDIVAGGPDRWHKPEYEAYLATLAANRRLVMFFVCADMAAIMLCPVVSVWLAFRQKRSVIVWFLLGVFGTVGSVIRLIAEQRKNARLVHG